MQEGRGIPRPHRTHVRLAAMDASSYIWVESGQTSLPVDAHLAPSLRAVTSSTPTSTPSSVVFRPNFSTLCSWRSATSWTRWPPVTRERSGFPWLHLGRPRHRVPRAAWRVLRGNVVPGSARERVLQAVSSTIALNDWRRPYLPSEMAETYAASHVVINPPAKGDLNMRFFEALACGAMVVTTAIGNGQADIALEGRDFVVVDFGDAQAVSRAVVIAADRASSAPWEPSVRRRLVADGHTYDHRVRTIAAALHGAPRVAPVRRMREQERARLLFDLAEAYDDLGLLWEGLRSTQGRGVPSSVGPTACRAGRRLAEEAIDGHAPGVGSLLRRLRGSALGSGRRDVVSRTSAPDTQSGASSALLTTSAPGRASTSSTSRWKRSDRREPSTSWRWRIGVRPPDLRSSSSTVPRTAASSQGF